MSATGVRSRPRERASSAKADGKCAVPTSMTTKAPPVASRTHQVGAKAAEALGGARAELQRAGRSRGSGAHVARRGVRAAAAAAGTTCVREQCVCVCVVVLGSDRVVFRSAASNTKSWAQGEERDGMRQARRTSLRALQQCALQDQPAAHCRRHGCCSDESPSIAAARAVYASSQRALQAVEASFGDLAIELCVLEGHRYQGSLTAVSRSRGDLVV